MAAPTVTRPLATVEHENQQPSTATLLIPYLKWVVALAFLVGIGALCVTAVITIRDRMRRTETRQAWNQLYEALKDKPKPEDQIVALDGVSEKIKGTATHADALIKLGKLHFDNAMKLEKSPEERNASLDKALSAYKTVATEEPYKSNLAFDLLAVNNLAMVQEQKGDYDSAIKTLGDAIKEPSPDRVKHYLYNKTVAELGRLYYLRSLKFDKGSAERQKDEGLAITNLDQALKAISSAEKSSRNNELTYFSYLSYIKSLIAKPGKALVDGKIPPAKITPPAVVIPAIKEEPKKDDAKKEEPKKTGGLNNPTPAQNPLTERESSIPASEHVSFAQIKEMFKNGNTSFCGCNRCALPASPSSAKMIE